MGKIIKEIGKTGETGEAGKAGENRLRAMCDGLSPQKRIAVIIVYLIVFAVLAIYMAVISIYGKNKQELNVEHIRTIRDYKVINDFNDLKINNLKNNNYDDNE